MNPIAKIGLLVSLAGASIPVTFAEPPAPAPAPALAVAMPRVLAVAHAFQLSGEIAITDQNGQSVDHAFGFADRASKRSHRRGERWLWASVTKQVTAILVMQEVERGKLSLEDTIRTHLPEFAGESGDRVTLKQLLQHVSGLPDPGDTAPDDTSTDGLGVPGFYLETGASITDAARAKGFCAGPPRAEPGAGFAYNNCDYLVLGAILERVTGKTYAALVADRIAIPLGLKSLRLADDAARQGTGVTGYTTGGKPYPAINVATFGAAGALTGSASDLLKLDRALMTGALLKPASRAVLWRGDPKMGYEALGVWSFPARLKGCAAPVALIERRGDVGGIQVRNVIAPEIGRAMVVFTNDDTIDFGEVWQGSGLTYDLLSAAFCAPL